MDPEKRLDFIVDAFVILSEKIPNAHLVFAGDGSARKSLEAKAKATSVKDRIHFLGMVNRAELPDVFHDSTVFLSASTTEVHPISAIEAIASGLPMVVVKDEAFEGMVEDDVNGYMTPLDLNAYAETLVNLLGDKTKLENFGKQSAALSEKYSIDGQVRALEKLYLEAILQNWRGHTFQRVITKTFNEIPSRINRRFHEEMEKILPSNKKK